MRPTGHQTQKRRPEVGRRFQMTLSRSRERDQFRLLPNQIDPVELFGDRDTIEHRRKGGLMENFPQAALERNIEWEQEGIDRLTREIKQLKKDSDY